MAGPERRESLEFFTHYPHHSYLDLGEDSVNLTTLHAQPGNWWVSRALDLEFFTLYQLKITLGNDSINNLTFSN